MSRSLPYIYVNNFKAGCSTVRRTLWSAEHKLGFTSLPPGHPHRPQDQLPFLHNEHPRWENTEDQFIFTFVRNPYARVLSAYLDKIAHPPEPAVWPPFAARHGLDAPPSFADFLDLIAGEQIAEMDPHWRPQSVLIGLGIVPFDFIGSVELMDEDLRQVLKVIFGHDLPDGPVCPAPYRGGRSGHAPLRSGRGKSRTADLQERFRCIRLWQRARLPDAFLRPAAPTIARADAALGAWASLMRAGAHAQAAKVLEQARAGLERETITSNLAEQRWALGQQLFAQGRFAEAIREYEPAQAGPIGARVTERLIACHDALAEQHGPGSGAAIDHLAAAATLSHDNPDRWKRLGKALLRGGRQEAGLEALIRSLALRDLREPSTQRRLRRARRSLALLRARQSRRGEAFAALRLGSPAGGSDTGSGRQWSVGQLVDSVAIGVVATIAKLVPTSSTAGRP